MISFWAMVLFLIGDSACSSSEMRAKEGSCVTVRLTLSKTKHSGYIVWFKDAVWNKEANDYEGTIVHSLKPDKHNASEFENRVSVGSTGSTWGLKNYELTISNLRLEDSGNYLVRYYDEANPSYKMSSSTMSLNVQENPCQVSVTGPELVQTGAEVILRCSTVGRCQNSPEWRSSGSGLASSEVSDTQGAKTAQLRFEADWSHDRVTFSCWPSPGNDACASRNITLAVEYSPKDTEAKVVDYDVIKEGQEVTFSCHSKGNPQPTLSLFKLGQGEIAQGGEWKLPNVKIEDAGSYFCQAKNKLGTENSTNVMLDVKYPPKEVRITASRTLEGISEGAAVSLTCEVQSSNPSMRSYSWYRDHTTLLETGPVLRFPAVRPEDRGSYRCKASNSAGSGDSPEVTITVHYGPRGTKIKASCCENGVKAGESLTLTCETDARPEPYGHTWFRTITGGGQRGPGRTEVAVPSNGWSGGRDLKFWHISAGDAGEYTCQAKNTISAQNSTALRVDVLYGPTGLALSMDSEARESSLVTIHCSVESFPLSELTLTWAPPSSDRLSDLSRHPKRLQGNYTDQPTRTSLVASFIASVEQAGRYTCRAKNSEGLKETTKDLVVHYAPKDVRATANPGGEVNEKTNLDLSCEARSNPGVTAYTWFKLTGRGAREVGKGRVLTIWNLSEAHAGQYFCRTRNKIGEGNSSVIDVTVRYGPRKTEVVHNMTSRGQPVKESAVALMCRSQSYPPIRSYKWHIQKDVNAVPSLRPGQNLTIGSDEEGTYYCSAENEISSSSSERIVIRFYRSSTRTLIMATSCFFVVIIILVIVIVILLYRKRRKSARQRLENGSRSDTWETLVMDGMGGPQRSRETLSTVMAPPPGPPANQHGHDSELYASPHTVNSPLKFPEKTKQAKSSGLPHRDGGGPAEEDGINYASLQFPGKGNRMDPKPEETECVYSKLAKPIRKQEVEAEEAEYENVKEAVPRWTERESDSDSETSDEDPDVCYTTVSFAPQTGPPGPRGAHCQGDSDTSDEDDYKSQYSNVKA